VSGPQRQWAFVSSHGAVLIEVARHGEATVREIADQARLTERQAHRVLGDLVDEGYVTRERVGRRNRYRVNRSMPMRHPVLADYRIGELLQVLAPGE
jgi:DNA-binding transcriptional ArsR family regulator